MTLVEFLRARLAEDRATAQAATAGPWGAFVRAEVYVEQTGAEDGHLVAELPDCGDHDSDRPADAAHIARHDPARVLAEVAAKEAILDECLGVQEQADRDWNDPGLNAMAGAYLDVVKLLAAVHAGHPDYDESWRP